MRSPTRTSFSFRKSVSRCPAIALLPGSPGRGVSDRCPAAVRRVLSSALHAPLSKDRAVRFRGGRRTRAAEAVMKLGDLRLKAGATSAHFLKPEETPGPG